MHWVMPREEAVGTGMGQKGITISKGCVATEKCQEGQWLGKGSCGGCALSSMGRIQGTLRKQDRTGQVSSMGGRGSRTRRI